MKTLKNETITEVFNKETQQIELLTTSKTFRVPVKNNDKFYMTYIGASQYILQIKSLIDVKVLASLCEEAEYDTGKVSLPTETRKTICKLIELDNSSFSKSLKRLKELNLITGKGGVFYINPNIFWKGSAEKRNELIKQGKISLLLDFEIEDETNN